MTPDPCGTTEVYPRTGGGNRLSEVAGESVVGLSPHGRGKRHSRVRSRLSLGSIPARAGETGVGNGSRPASTVYPRTGGGNGRTCSDRGLAGGLSPHGRGKLRAAAAVEVGTGSIPARAGETD